jgi:hypothetical protein
MVVTQYVSSITPLDVTRRAFSHGAAAFLVGACLQIWKGACCVLTFDISIETLEDPANRGFICIACGNIEAAFVPVVLSTGPIGAVKVSMGWLQDVTLWACHCRALTLLTTALVVVLVCAILIRTEDVSSIPLQLIIRRTLHEWTPAFHHGTGVQILDCAGRVQASDIGSI